MKASSSIYLISILTLSLLFTFNNLSNADLINDVCKKTDYPDVCISILRSDPTSANADVQELIILILKASTSYASKTLIKINDLMKETTNGYKKLLYMGCTHGYKVAIADIALVVDKLRSKSYDYAKIEIDSFRQEAEDCEDNFSAPPGPIYQSNLTDRNLMMMHFADICTKIIVLYF
ncbi:pectinesterase inhibitor-like [Impatiens glandulifera]|uniref:pectinesterase inhibitor-like n=1 Tax=Impatiens glandulifera TaxID=253017 RepID=UPI001FB04C4C|nr:pectinesterase inhibitor-like [Impatiens glandulifera]